jgi:transposase
MAKTPKSFIKSKKHKPKLRTLNFKVEEAEAKSIKTIAKRYTRGNVTVLARLAIQAYRPKKADLAKLNVRASTR